MSWQEHEVEKELKQINGKTIESATVEWLECRHEDSEPHEIKLKFTDGTHMHIHAIGWGNAELVTYYYRKI